MKSVATFLWFNNDAEAATKFYLSVFKKNAELIDIKRAPDGKVIATNFLLQGREMARISS